MKVKFMIVYLVAGAAFLGVSLWVILSGGRSASAIRAKYRLGGIMLTALTMLTAASCGGVPPQVTCYEPAVTCYDMPAETDILEVKVKGAEGMKAKAGDVLKCSIQRHSHEQYILKITAKDEEKTLLQTQDIKGAKPETDPFEFEVKLAPGDFKGEATVTVYSHHEDGEGKVWESALSNQPVIVIY
ncbi:MAG: hypothetical protein J5640_02600 [Bacteroidales bacterium]|nr:hypothetical protein [Bacteroidales bacterium]